MGSYVGQILDLEGAAPEELLCCHISPAEINPGQLGPLEWALQNHNSTTRSCVCPWELAHPLLLLKTLSCYLNPPGCGLFGWGWEPGVCWAPAPALPVLPSVALIFSAF